MKIPASVSGKIGLGALTHLGVDKVSNSVLRQMAGQPGVRI